MPGIIESHIGKYGLRKDGTKKGSGFLGELKTTSGDVATELSIGVDFGKGETEIPLLVPTLSKQEIDYLLSGGKVTKEIADKAIAHAIDRLKSGQSPFANNGDPNSMPGAK